MGSGGVGSQQHVTGELFKMMTGVNMQHVPHRGGAPAVADLLAGPVQQYPVVTGRSSPT
jgi:tripartite-type tricarboxylate transporter receptor subunit TctC